MSANHKSTPSLQKVTWSEVSKEVCAKNPQLAKIINDINPGPEHYLYKASYPFGSEILREGPLYLPNKRGKLHALNDPHNAPEIKKDLDYNFNNNPITFVLQNSVELFIAQGHHVLPFYAMISEGNIFGTWRILSSKHALQPAFLYSMTAGARSLFMLPKISEKGKHNKLIKNFGLNTPPPKHALNHWNVFREIAQHPDFEEPWHTELLFFPKKWVESIRKDPAWAPLENFLLRKAWDDSDGVRGQYMWDLVLATVQHRREMNPERHITETIKNLLCLASGNLPGFGPAPGFAPATDNLAGPIRRLQEIYVNIYKLSDYAPIIMQPKAFSLNNPQPIYYSLSHANTTTPLTRKGQISKIFDIYNLKNLLQKYLDSIREMDLHLYQSMLFDLPNAIEYDFFHTDHKHYRDIYPTTDIPLGDANFRNIPHGGEREFPSSSSFINGCIRIQKKS